MSIHGLEVRDGIVMDGVAAEHIREAVPVIASYGDAIGIRAFADRKKIEDDIAEASREIGADLVIMMTSGRSGFGDRVRGCLAERVIRRVECPVLTVPAVRTAYR